MKIIIPMAGMGKRMRPHTLTIPKPLIPVAGKPIVQRLVEDISRVCGKQIDEIGFIIGNFGADVEKQLLDIAASVGAKGKIYYQEKALGTAHAVYCAEPSLTGNVVVAFADTLFVADFKLDTSKDSIIWVQKVADPSQFGVVTLNQNKVIDAFVEKPKNFVSDLAIIGIYYFKDGENLKKELKYLLDNNVVVNGEYQLTDALQNMKMKGLEFSVGEVHEWLDCGNKDATVLTNTRVLHNYGSVISKNVKLRNSTIIEPCCIQDGVEIENSVVGPYVTIGAKTTVTSSIVKNSIIQAETIIANVVADNSMIGNSCVVKGRAVQYNLGDFIQVE